MECLITARVAGPCFTCGEYQLAGMHTVDHPVLGLCIWCEKCCPAHLQASLDWDQEAAADLTGEQITLF